MDNYYSIMRNSKDKKVMRRSLAISAQEIGIRKTALKYKCSRGTVKKWFDRYRADGNNGLEELPKTPHNCKCTSNEDKAIIRKAKQKYKPLGARRLKDICTLPYSVKTIHKVLKEANLTRKVRKKRTTKNNLRHIKALWALCSQIQVDTKHLYDMPEYWLGIKGCNLPKYQYTAREVSCGLLFVSYAYELSISNSISFIEQVAQHLLTNGIDLSHTIIQTDNGSEFIGAWNAKRDSGFTKKVEEYGMTHNTIKPRAHTWQSDVETSHNLIEHEFYNVEPLASAMQLINKMSTYLCWFNHLRRNSYKENKTPLELAIAKIPAINNNIANFKSIILDFLNYVPHNRVDHDVGVLP
jgi:transposase